MVESRKRAGKKGKGEGTGQEMYRQQKTLPLFTQTATARLEKK
jgi:hypothetical protein